MIYKLTMICGSRSTWRAESPFSGWRNGLHHGG